MFEEIIGLNSTSAEAYVGKGLALHELQDYKSASNTFEQAERCWVQCYYPQGPSQMSCSPQPIHTTFLAPQNKWNTVLRFTEMHCVSRLMIPIWLAGHARTKQIQEISGRRVKNRRRK